MIYYIQYIHIVAIKADHFMSYSNNDVETHETSLGTRTSDTSIDEVSYTLVCVHVLIIL